jgi:hypothetical protein
MVLVRLALVGLALATLTPAYAAEPRAEVTLPWNDFKTLYDKGQAPKDPPAVAPLAYTLDHATYTGKVVGTGDDAYALLHVTIRGRMLRDNAWASVPLLSTNSALKSAKVNGQDAAIYLNNGFYTLVTNQKGVFVAELDLAMALMTADGETGFALPLAPTGATEVSFTVESPEKVALSVAGGRGVVQGDVGTEHTVSAVVPSLGSLAVSWQKEVKELLAEKLQPRVYAESQVLVGVSEGFLQGRANVNYTILHKGVDHVRVHVPTDVTVLDVQGPGLSDWKVDAAGNIDVALNYEALGAYRLTVDYERALSGATQVPLVTAQDVARSVTWVGVDARSAVEVVAGAATGAVPVDVRELPAALVGQTDFPVLLGYKSRDASAVIPLEVRSHADVDMLVTLVDSAIIDTLVTADGRRMTHLQYAVRNNRNQFLRMKLPENAEVWSATVAGRGVKVAKGDGGVLVPLVRSDASSGALSAFLVDLVYVEAGAELGESGTARIALPSVNAPTSQLQWTVYFPDNAKVAKNSFAGSIRHVEWYSTAPQLPSNATVTERDRQAVKNAAAGMADTMGQGVEPVDVQLPLAGKAIYFEKMLALDEDLWASFDYRIKKP